MRRRSMAATKAIYAGVLFVVAVGLTLYVATYERGEKPEKGQVWRRIPIDKAEVLEVKKGKETLRLEKRGDDWWLTEPFEALADNDTVKRMVEAVARIKYVDRYEQWDSSVKDYGFDEPTLIATLTYDGGKQVTVTLGAETPTGGNRYAKVSKDGALYTVSSMVKTDLDKSPDDVREKRLARFESDDVQRVTLSYNGKKVVVVRNPEEEEHKWQIVKPINAAADDWSVDNNIVNKLRDLEAKEFVLTNASKINEKKYGFDKPQLVATIEVKGREPIVIQFGKKVPKKEEKESEATPTPTPTWSTSTEEAIYARALGRNDVVTVEASVLEDLRKEPKDLRDKTVCKFEREDVQEIVIEPRGEAKITLKRTKKKGDKEAEWAVVTPKSVEPDTSKVDSLLWDFTSLKAYEFVVEKASTASLKKYGLDKPKVKITFRLKKEEPVTVLFGKQTEKEDFKYYYAKVVGKPFVVLVNEYIYNDIPKKLADIKKPEPTPTPTPEKPKEEKKEKEESD